MVYAFLNVIESLINAVYWFRRCLLFLTDIWRLTTDSFLLYFQIHPHLVDGAAYDPGSSDRFPQLPSACLRPVFH